MNEDSLKLLRLLLIRLERISVDSYWAHRASGVRGSLLRVADKIEKGAPPAGESLEQLIDNGFFILENAAEERIKK